MNNSPKLNKTITEAERLDAAVDAMTQKFATLADRVEAIGGKLNDAVKRFDAGTGKS